MSKELYKKRQEIQHKLFFKFLKQNNEWTTFLKLHNPNSRDVLGCDPLNYLKYGMRDYIFCFFNQGYSKFTQLDRKWGEIVDKYKKIKKKDYKIYGK